MNWSLKRVFLHLGWLHTKKMKTIIFYNIIETCWAEYVAEYVAEYCWAEYVAKRGFKFLLQKRYFEVNQKTN